MIAFLRCGVIFQRFLKEKCHLTNSEISRYSRQLILPQFGVSGQLKLRSARVLIVGCGGLGCPASVYLAAAGVGTIGLLDHDLVELNNLHRQVAHSESTVNLSKVVSLAQRCKQLNSNVNIECHEVHLDNSNAVDIISKYDVVVDCSDNLATRYLINDACAITGPKPLVSGSALRLEGQMTVYLTKKILSKEELESNVLLPMDCRAPCFRCLFPVPPPAGTVQGCSEAGVFGVVPGIIGTMQAAEVIKIVTGIGDVHTGRLFLLDVERNLTRSVKLRDPVPNCPVCSPEAVKDFAKIRLTDYVSFCGAPDCDKPSNVNLTLHRDRITVQQLKSWIDNQIPHLLIDLRTLTEFEICHLKPCLHVPGKDLFRDSLISQIHQTINNELSKGAQRPFPVVLICHKGNRSEQAAPQLASALESIRRSNSVQDLAIQCMNSDSQCNNNCNNINTMNLIDFEDNGQNDFVVCDVAGGLAAWSAQVDPNFPIY